MRYGREKEEGKRRTDCCTFLRITFPLSSAFDRNTVSPYKTKQTKKANRMRIERNISSAGNAGDLARQSSILLFKILFCFIFCFKREDIS